VKLNLKFFQKFFKKIYYKVWRRRKKKLNFVIINVVIKVFFFVGKFIFFKGKFFKEVHYIIKKRVCIKK